MSQVLIHRRDAETLRRPMNQLCDLGVSAVNHLAGQRWNRARYRRRGDEREQAPGAAPKTAVTDVADVPRESPAPSSRPALTSGISGAPEAERNQAAAVSQPACRVPSSRDQFPPARTLPHTGSAKGTVVHKAVMLRGSTGRFSSAESWPAKYIRRDNKLSRPFVSAGRFSCRDCMNSPIMPMKPPTEAHIS